MENKQTSCGHKPKTKSLMVNVIQIGELFCQCQTFIFRYKYCAAGSDNKRDDAKPRKNKLKNQACELPMF